MTIHGLKNPAACTALSLDENHCGTERVRPHLNQCVVEGDIRGYDVVLKSSGAGKVDSEFTELTDSKVNTVVSSKFAKLVRSEADVAQSTGEVMVLSGSKVRTVNITNGHVALEKKLLLKGMFQANLYG